MRVPPGLAVNLGQLPHVAVADCARDPGQRAHGRGGRAADPPVRAALLEVCSAPRSSEVASRSWRNAPP